MPRTIHKPIRAAIVEFRVQVQLQARRPGDALPQQPTPARRKVEMVLALELAQMQLMQAEKMASLGQLAAGIAHEINNPVGFVGSNLGALEGYLKDLFAIIEAYEQGGVAACADPASFAQAQALRQKADYDFLREDSQTLLKESQEGVDRCARSSVTSRTTPT